MTAGTGRRRTAAHRAALVALAALAAASLVVAGSWAPAAHAQESGPWRITDYDVEIDVQDDSTLAVTERIEVFFDGDQRGILRYWDVYESLPEPLPPESTIQLDGDPADYQRVTEIDDIVVSSPSGAPSDVDLSTSGDELTARIGDPDIFVTDRQSYVIQYTVRGGMNAFTDHDELYWDPIGSWGVEVQDLEVRVTAPGIQQVACYAGSAGTSDVTCPIKQDGDTATFAFGRLAPEAFPSVVAGLEPGAVDVSQPILRRRPGPTQALVGNPWSVPGSALVFVAGFALAFSRLWRTGRDRQAVGGVTAAGAIRSDAEGRRRGLFDTPPVPVLFRPPNDLRPGVLGVIIDERVDPVDVSASIVDLATRGYLTITEAPGTGWFSKDDWHLSRVPGVDMGVLAAWESELLDGLFDDRTMVTVTELKGTFSGTYQKVSTMLYDTVTSNGWFRRDPSSARTIWVVIGLVLAALGFASFFLLMVPGLGAISVALFLVGVLVAILSRWAPARTPSGSRLLVDTMGFREFIERAEADRMDFAEKEQIFADYLPYAIVFGVVDRWAEAFADIGVDIGSAVGGYYTGVGVFDAVRFSHGMNAFSNVASSAVSAAPPSSSGGGSGFSGGGFSGGGGGGGGGGAW